MVASPLVSCSKRRGSSLLPERREGSEVSTAWTNRKRKIKNSVFLNMEGTALWLLGLASLQPVKCHPRIPDLLQEQTGHLPLLGSYLTFTVSVSRDCFQEAAAPAPSSWSSLFLLPRAQRILLLLGRHGFHDHRNLAAKCSKTSRCSVKWGPKHLLKDPELAPFSVHPPHPYPLPTAVTPQGDLVQPFLPWITRP